MTADAQTIVYADGTTEIVCTFFMNIRFMSFFLHVIRSIVFLPYVFGLSLWYIKQIVYKAVCYIYLLQLLLVLEKRTWYNEDKVEEHKRLRFDSYWTYCNGPFSYICVISAYAPYALGGGASYSKNCITHIRKSLQRRALKLIILPLDLLHV